MRNKILSIIIVLLLLNFIRVVIIKINNPNYNFFIDNKKTTTIKCSLKTTDMYKITYKIKEKKYKINKVTIKYEDKRTIDYKDGYSETSSEINKYKLINDINYIENDREITFTFDKYIYNKNKNNKDIKRMFSYNDLISYLKKENYTCK